MTVCRLIESLLFKCLKLLENQNMRKREGKYRVMEHIRVSNFWFVFCEGQKCLSHGASVLASVSACCRVREDLSRLSGNRCWISLAWISLLSSYGAFTSSLIFLCFCFSCKLEMIKVNISGWLYFHYKKHLEKCFIGVGTIMQQVGCLPCMWSMQVQCLVPRVFPGVIPECKARKKP